MVGNNRISSPVIFFSIYIAIMLFQPEGWGTYFAIAVIVLTLITCVVDGRASLRSFYMPRASRCIFVFMVLMGLSTMFVSGELSSYNKLVAQIILFLFMSGVAVSDDEREFLRWFFIVVNVIYAILAIRYCISAGETRYYHSRIEILGARFDSNFIGIPFVAAATYLLDNILNGRKRVFSTIMYFIVSIAIVLTASHGNMLSWILASVLVVLIFLKDKNMMWHKKLFLIIAVLVLAYVLNLFLSANYSEQWSRMTSFETGSDNGRFELWNLSIDLWKTSPIFGGGMEYLYTETGHASHNTFIQIIVNSGVIGCLAFTGFLFGMIIKAWRYDKALFAVLCGMLIQIAFLDALDNRVVWIIFCIISMIAAQKEMEPDTDIVQG